MKPMIQSSVAPIVLSWGFLASGLVAVIASGSAQAGTVIPGSSASVIIADPSSSFGYDTLLHTSSAAQYGASASSNIASGPTLIANGTSQGSFNGGVASLTYDFTFSAPGGVTTTPIDLTYSYDFVGVSGASNPSNSTTGGSIKITNTSTRSSQYVINEQTRGSDAGTNIIDMLSLSAGTVYSITMSVGAYGGGSYAFLDPTLSVDPAFLTSSGYTASQFGFTLSDGVANGTVSVPEPGSLALLGLGLAGFGMLGRGRRSSTPPTLFWRA